ncbi:hypothetical protein [Cupriavidus necator]
MTPDDMTMTPMNVLAMPAPAAAVVQALREAGVALLIVGAYAVRFHGHLRPTQALDLWTPADADHLHGLAAVLARLNLSLPPDQLVQLVEGGARVVLPLLPDFALTLTTRMPDLRFGAALECADMAVVRGVLCPVLSLRDLYRSKRHSRRDQDLEDIGILSAGSAFDDDVDGYDRDAG